MPRAASMRRVAAARPPMRNPSRDRRQAELRQLRELVSALESERETLIKNQQFRRGATEEDVVMRRASAEEENEALRREIMRYVRMGELLVRSIAGHTSPLDDYMFRAGGRASSPSGVLHDDLALRFAVLREEVEQAYRDLDTIVKTSTEPRSFVKTTSSRFVDGCMQPVLEGTETETIPFDFAKCSAALWRATRSALWADYSDAEFYGDDAEYRMGRLRWTRDSLPLTCTVVIKRFMEKDRMLITWRGVTSIGEDENNYIEETGWSVMVRVQDESGSEFVAKTMRVEWVPRSQSGQSRPVADMAGLVAAITHDDTAAVEEMMENLLIEDCLTEEIPPIQQCLE